MYHPFTLDTHYFNHVYRIIEPLASRCSKFRFKSLDTSSTSARLAYIADAESLPVSPEVLKALISSSQGDLRRAITYLQSAARLNASGAVREADAMDDDASALQQPAITPRDIQEIAGVVPDDVVNSFASSLGVDIASTSDMDVDGAPQAKGFDPIRRKVRELMREGYSASQILSQVRTLKQCAFWTHS